MYLADVAAILKVNKHELFINLMFIDELRSIHHKHELQLYNKKLLIKLFIKHLIVISDVTIS